jgi:hypothetical protein
MSTQNVAPRILLDNGIFSHSDFVEGAIKSQKILWGDTRQTLDIHGFIRKAPHKDKNYQDQIDALFTIGRLIKEEKIIAYDYVEILFERFRAKGKIPDFNALRDCKLHKCNPALDRSKFRKTINLRDMISKGGKKDRKANVDLGQANQIAFFEWLNTLEKEYIDDFICNANQIGLTEFEVESLKNIDWFKFVCQRSESSENYPDVFHLWTVERNGLDAFLTLENSLPMLVSRINNEKKPNFKIQTEVLRPLDLLRKLGIKASDPVPIEKGRFYYFHEVMN